MPSPRILMVTTNGVNNYGAALQAYALHVKLSTLGIVSTLNYSNRHITSSMDLVRFSPDLRGALGAAKDIARIFSRARVIRKFLEFENNNLNLTRPLTRSELLSGGSEVFDLYISGSDQIWNPRCISASKTIDPTYFLDFAPGGARKASYASSIGGFRPTEAQVKQMCNLLRDYEAISVRERPTQSLLAAALKRNVFHSVDPTLLLRRDEWAQLTGAKTYDFAGEPYLLLYSVPKNPLTFQTAKRLSKKFKIPIVALDQDPFLRIRAAHHISDAGPTDFVSLFSRAAFVVTDSFHGVCFSLNFEVPFCVISKGEHANRITSILDRVSLADRLISEPAEIERISNCVDFSSASTKVHCARSDGLAYLAALSEKYGL